MSTMEDSKFAETGIASGRAGPTAAAAGKPAIEARVPQFAEITPQENPAGIGALDQLLDVSCTVTAELGRLNLAIGEVLKLHVGSVLELDRLIADPVDVVVQGVRMARG